jgi:hypothetical protein
MLAGVALAAVAAAAASRDWLPGDRVFAAAADGRAWAAAARGHRSGDFLAVDLAGHLAAALHSDRFKLGDVTIAAGRADQPLTPPDRITRVTEAGKDGAASAGGRPPARLLVAAQSPGRALSPGRGGFYAHGYGDETGIFGGGGLARDLARWINELARPGREPLAAAEIADTWLTVTARNRP